MQFLLRSGGLTQCVRIELIDGQNDPINELIEGPAFLNPVFLGSRIS
jgi:hypothetical protein